MVSRIAFPLVALVVAGGCSGRDATGPTSQNRSPSMSAPVSSFTATAPGNESLVREADVGSGGGTSRRILHVTKECSQFAGPPGSFCTITASNLKKIRVGWRVVYASGADATGAINSDVVLGPPGGGSNAAFGHCDVSNAPNGTNLGLCTFSGGTGEFTHFTGRFVVSGNDPLGIVYHWDGPYSFGPRDRD
jgi:hypothetical protein